VQCNQLYSWIVALHLWLHVDSSSDEPKGKILHKIGFGLCSLLKTCTSFFKFIALVTDGRN
jgi:hypothetical protein